MGIARTAVDREATLSFERANNPLEGIPESHLIRRVGRIHYYQIKFEGQGTEFNVSPEIYHTIPQMEAFIPMFFRVKDLIRHEPFDPDHAQWFASDEAGRRVGFTFVSSSNERVPYSAVPAPEEDEDNGNSNEDAGEEAPPSVGQQDGRPDEAEAPESGNDTDGSRGDDGRGSEKRQLNRARRGGRIHSDKGQSR
jgi:hypothetical protein